MRLRRYNKTELRCLYLGDLRLWFSYETLIAAGNVTTKRLLVTEEYYSKSTSRHSNVVIAEWGNDYELVRTGQLHSFVYAEIGEMA